MLKHFRGCDYSLYLTVIGSTNPAQVRRFYIDDQTFSDLNVFTSSGGSKPIYDLFKHTRTRAARSRLKEMMLQRFANISFHYLETYFENQKPVFSYVLKNGVSTENLGMYIVRNEGTVELLKQAATNSMR